MSAGPEALVYVLLAPSSTLSLQASDICDEKSEIIDQLVVGCLSNLLLGSLSPLLPVTFGCKVDSRA